MEGFDRNLDGYYDVEDQLPRFLRERAASRFQATRSRKDAIETIAEHERRVERVRDAFLTGIGGLPDDRTPLNPRTTGTLDRDGYAIETVVYESLPEFHVTGNLYLPDGDGPFPGVLFLPGHATAGKAAPAYQRACIDLARDGFVTFSIDPLGQGERVQSYDAETDIVERDSTIEHTYLGQQCRVAGTNIARYMVWDAMRALDYLERRPSVDGSRLGVTGNSGGGTQTTYLLLVDERPDAAVPCCSVSTREAYMETGQAEDSEQIIHGAIEHGIDYDDFVAAAAPTPVLIGCAQSDFRPIDGAHRSVDRLRKVYARYDRPDYIDIAVVPHTHGLTTPLREEMVTWFRTHLRDETSTFESDRPTHEDESTLHSTDAGQVHGEFSDETHLLDLNRMVIDRRYGNAGTTPPVEDARSYAERTRETVSAALNLDRPRYPLSPRRIRSEVDEDRGVCWEKVFFYTESGIVVAGVLAEGVRSPDRLHPTVVLPDHGTQEFEEYEARIADLARERGIAMAFDPRGVGAVRARHVNTPALNGGEYFDYFGTEYKLGSDALMLGSSLFGMRVFDVLRAREYLETRTDGSSAPDGYGLDGTGVGAMHALYAAAAEPQFRSLRLVDLPPSFYEVATHREYDIDFRLRTHGFVGTCDVPQLLPAVADREVTWVGTDPDRFR